MSTQKETNRQTALEIALEENSGNPALQAALETLYTDLLKAYEEGKNAF